MNRMPTAMFVFSLVLVSILNLVVVASATMPVPTGASFYKYDAETHRSSQTTLPRLNRWPSEP